MSGRPTRFRVRRAPRALRCFGVFWRFSLGRAPSRTEITCTSDEVSVLRAWLSVYGARSRSVPLPVPEYVRQPWRPVFRWTAAAWSISEQRLLTRSEHPEMVFARRRRW